MPTLKNLRAAAGLSQSELANASGVSLETIKKIEGDKVERPHPATLRQLAAVLGQVPATLHSSRNGHVLDPGMVDNARRDQVQVLEVVSDPGRPGGEEFVPLRETTLFGVIEGPLASLTLQQRFGYPRSVCDRVLEARYRFPLPGDAAVTGVKITFGEVVVETSLVARAEAEAQYAAARQEGRQATLASRESPDVFTLEVTGLQPDQDIVVETKFIQLARSEGPGWELRVPQTVGPRYSRADEAGGRAQSGQPLSVWRDPRHRFSLDLIVRDATAITSSSHALVLNSAPGRGQRVRLRDGSVFPDRDLVLTWRPEETTDRATLDVIVHEDIEEGMRYFLALVSPPVLQGAAMGVDREITLLIDRSGSMAGAKWEACRWAVRRFLAGVRSTDTFNLGLFQSACDWLASAPLPGTDASRARALRFLDDHAPDGGTELGPALEQALRASRTADDRVRHVLLLTDAQVSDEGRIMQLVEAEAGRADRRSLSLICIDAAPKSAFVHDLAEAGGGMAVFLSSDPQHEDITSALDRVLDAWSRPVASDLKLVVETRAAALEARGARGVTRSEVRLGDLPMGQSLWVSGAMSVYSAPEFRLCAGERVLETVSIALERSPLARPVIRALFGAHQLVRLERCQAARYDEAARDALLDALGYAGDPLLVPEPAPLYAENAALVRANVIEKLLVCDSLRFGLVCSATAFVGVRTEAGQRVDATVVVPSALPAGWDDAFVDQVGAPLAVQARPMPLIGAPPAAASPRSDFDQAEPASLRRPKRSVDSADEHVAGAGRTLRFHGVPILERDAAALAVGVAGVHVGLRPRHVRASIESAELSALDEASELWVCIDASDTPVVRMKLWELLTLGRERPLNLQLRPGQRVSLRLVAFRRPWPRAARLLVELA